MPERPIIEYYEAGAPISDSIQPDNAQDYKDRAKEYKDMLRTEYYDNENPRGAVSLYYILKARHPDDGPHPRAHPPKRFVKEWVIRQGKNQVFRNKKGKAKAIQSVVVGRPNELIQVDYIYFFRNITPSVIVADEPDLTNEKRDELKEQEKEFAKVFKGKAQYRGAITAVDCFSRFAYVVPIAGPVNSASAKEAMVSIIQQAEARYKRKVERIQTDKGSEFMKDFRKYLKDKKAQHPEHYSHRFGYEGRSHSQAIVERFNGTFRRMMLAVLGKSIVTPTWTEKYKKVLSNYNATPHTTLTSKYKRKTQTTGAGTAADPYKEETSIKEKNLIAPRDVPPAPGTAEPTWKAVQNNIIDHGIKSKTRQDPVYQVGDYVRIRIFKPKKDKPSFTYKKGPLWEIQKKGGGPVEEFQGVYLVTGVRGGRSGKIARAPTYTILARWSKESTPDFYEANQEPDGTLPSGVSTPSAADRTIDAPGSIFDGKVYEKPAYPRRFLKEELVRVRQDKKGVPIVQWGTTEKGGKGKQKTGEDVLDIKASETLEEYEVETVLRWANKSKTKVEVKWVGYPSSENTTEPVTQIKHTQPYLDFIKKK